MTRQPFWIARTHQNFFQNFRLRLSLDEKEHRVRLIDHRPSQSNPPGILLRNPIRSDQSPERMNCLRVRKDGSRMPVVTHTKLDQIKSGALRSFQAKSIPQQ